MNWILNNLGNTLLVVVGDINFISGGIKEKLMIQKYFLGKPSHVKKIPL